MAMILPLDVFAETNMYKNIDLTVINLDVDIAKEFIDHRINKRARLTQASMERLVKKAITISEKTGMPVEDIFTETIDAGWQGFRLEYFQNRRPEPKQQAFERLTDTSWTQGLTVVK